MNSSLSKTQACVWHLRQKMNVQIKGFYIFKRYNSIMKIDLLNVPTASNRNVSKCFGGITEKSTDYTILTSQLIFSDYFLSGAFRMGSKLRIMKKKSLGECKIAERVLSNKTERESSNFDVLSLSSWEAHKRTERGWKGSTCQNIDFTSKIEKPTFSYFQRFHIKHVKKLTFVGFLTV